VLCVASSPALSSPPLPAAGSGSEGAQTSLQEVYSKVGSTSGGTVCGSVCATGSSSPPTQDMTLAEAEVHVLTILKQIMEEKLTSVNIQVGFHLCDGSACCVLL